MDFKETDHELGLFHKNRITWFKKVRHIYGSQKTIIFSKMKWKISMFEIHT